MGESRAALQKQIPVYIVFTFLRASVVHFQTRGIPSNQICLRRNGGHYITISKLTDTQKSSFKLTIYVMLYLFGKLLLTIYEPKMGVIVD